MTVAPPKTITQLRHRLPGWKITYTTEECTEVARDRRTPYGDLSCSRRLVMHVIHAIPQGFARTWPWRGVPYIEVRAREKREACNVILRGIRALEDFWAEE